jgi:hypothetical protein
MGVRTKSRVRISRDGDVLVLRSSRRQLGIAGFLTVWLVGWTGGCA